MDEGLAVEGEGEGEGGICGKDFVDIAIAV